MNFKNSYNMGEATNIGSRLHTVHKNGENGRNFVLGVSRNVGDFILLVCEVRLCTWDVVPLESAIGVVYDKPVPVYYSFILVKRVDEELKYVYKSLHLERYCSAYPTGPLLSRCFCEHCNILFHDRSTVICELVFSMHCKTSRLVRACVRSVLLCTHSRDSMRRKPFFFSYMLLD